MPFSKNKYMSASEISSSSTFTMFRLANQTKAGALKQRLGHDS